MRAPPSQSLSWGSLRVRPQFWSRSSGLSDPASRTPPAKRALQRASHEASVRAPRPPRHAGERCEISKGLRPLPPAPLLIACMAGLVGGVSWTVDWPIGWHVGNSAGWPVVWLAVWQVGWQVGRLAGWLIGWLVGLSVGWLRRDGNQRKGRSQGRVLSGIVASRALNHRILQGIAAARAQGSIVFDEGSWLPERGPIVFDED